MLSRVILHECYYKYEYISKLGEVNEFQGRLEEIKKMNCKLSNMYEYIGKVVPGIKVIKKSNNNYYASENHIWGLSPVHYTDEYYIDIGVSLIKYD